MSTEPLGVSHDPDDLQFDQAEFADPADLAVTCNACAQPITDEYYEVNGNVLCDRCRQGVSAYFAGGSPIGRLFRATLLGSLTALVCTILYATFRYFSPIDITLTTILIGIGIGKMVRKGTGDRGGLVYQFLAVFLTYSSLAMAYFISIVAAMIVNPPQDDAAPDAPVAQNGPAAPGQQANPAQPAPPIEAAEEAAEEVKGEAVAQAKGQGAPANAPARVNANANGQPQGLPGGTELIFALVMLLGLAYAIPFQMITVSPILILFVAFGLWEAWKINKRTPISITGPHRVGSMGHA